MTSQWRKPAGTTLIEWSEIISEPSNEKTLEKPKLRDILRTTGFYSSKVAKSLKTKAGWGRNESDKRADGHAWSPLEPWVGRIARKTFWCKWWNSNMDCGLGNCILGMWHDLMVRIGLWFCKETSSLSGNTRWSIQRCVCVFRRSSVFAAHSQTAQKAALRLQRMAPLSAHTLLPVVGQIHHLVCQLLQARTEE